MISIDAIVKAIWDENLTGLALLDSEGKFLKVNQKFCDIVKYTEEQLKHKTFKDITHPDDLEDDIFFVEKCLASRINQYSMYKRYLTKTNEIVWVKLKVLAIKDGENIFYFLSEITPIVPLPEVMQKDSKEEKPSKKNLFYQFLENNWLKILSGILGVIAFGYQFYHSIEILKLNLNTQQQQIEEILETLKTQDKNEKNN